MIRLKNSKKIEYKNILVTGASGLIGRSLISLLVKKGYNVTAIDIFKRDIEYVKFIQGDFANSNLMNVVLKEIDVVIHLAAMLGVDQCRLHPKEVIKVNYKDTKNLIDLCVKNKIKKFIFTSSSEVYGDSKDVPYKETAKLTPVSVYGQSKVLVEKYLEKVQTKSKIKIGIARLFNIYGFNQRPVFVVPILINLAFQNKPLKIFGDGEQIRSFTYIDDGVLGIFKLMLYENKPFEIINIGRNIEYSIKKVAEIILKNLPKSKSKIKLIPYGSKGVRQKSLEIKRRVPSVEKANKLLDFKAKISLEEGLSKIIKKWKYFYKTTGLKPSKIN